MAILPTMHIEYQTYKTYYLYFERTPSLQGFQDQQKAAAYHRLIAHNYRIAQPPSAKVERVQGYY